MRSSGMPFRRAAIHSPLPYFLLFVLAFGPGTPAVPFLRFAAAGTVTADSFPLCPLTKKPPVKRDYPSTRCVEASEYSCCTECYDWFNALVITSANSSSIIEYFAPSLTSLFASKAVVVSDGSRTARVSTWARHLSMPQYGCRTQGFPAMILAAHEGFVRWLSELRVVEFDSRSTEICRPQ